MSFAGREPFAVPLGAVAVSGWSSAGLRVGWMAPSELELAVSAAAGESVGLDARGARLRDRPAPLALAVLAEPLESAPPLPAH